MRRGPEDPSVHKKFRKLTETLFDFKVKSRIIDSVTEGPDHSQSSMGSDSDGIPSIAKMV